MTDGFGGFDFARMPPARPVVDAGDFVPNGPALLYVHCGSGGESATLTRVDHAVPMIGGTRAARLERAVLRVLLTEALALLDEAEGT
jgi:hypothetical protein